MTVNMPEEVRAALWVRHLAEKNPSAGFAETLSTLLVNNARIANRHFPFRVGELREGCAADLVLVDYEPPTALDESTLLGHLTFGISQAVVDTTVVGGSVLMAGKKLELDLDEAEVAAKARERARTVMGRNYVQHQHPNRIGTVQMASTKLDPAMPDEAVTVDYLMENVWIVGDPAECADKIRQLHAESGGFGSLLAITTDSDDAGWDHESLRLLIEDVAPRVADLA